MQCSLQMEVLCPRALLGFLCVHLREPGDLQLRKQRHVWIKLSLSTRMSMPAGRGAVGVHAWVSCTPGAWTWNRRGALTGQRECSRQELFCQPAFQERPCQQCSAGRSSRAGGAQGRACGPSPLPGHQPGAGGLRRVGTPVAGRLGHAWCLPCGHVVTGMAGRDSNDSWAREARQALPPARAAQLPGAVPKGACSSGGS